MDGYTRREAEALLARAVEIDGTSLFDDELRTSDLERIAEELGISRPALAASLAEGAPVAPDPDGLAWLGPRQVTVVRSGPLPAARAELILTRELERRGLQEVRPGEWTQRQGWWPDLHRVTSQLRLFLDVGAHPDGSRARVAVQLGEPRRAHLLLALLGVTGAALVPAAVAFPLSIPVAGLAIAASPAVATLSYRRRIRLIEERLDDLLGGVFRS